jgi:hypothetical protein
MFSRGEKVILVDDRWPFGIERLYKELPKKDVVYVIRDVFLGRGPSKPNSKPGDEDGEVGVLLIGINNPKDPRNLYGHELGFNAMRFRKLDELKDENKRKAGLDVEVEEEELVPA